MTRAPGTRPVTAGRLGAARAARRAAPEAGFTLVELMISAVVLLVALSMTTVIVSVVSQQSTSQLNQGRATETAEVALTSIAQYLQGAVSPMAAYNAEQGNAAENNYPSTGYCWNETYPGPSTSLQSPLIVSSSFWTGNSESYNNNTVKEVDPSTLSIIYAHDYDIEFCGYPPGSTTPAVYEIYLNESTCTNSTYGYCTVDVVKYTVTTTGTCSSWANLYHQPTGSCASVVGQIPDVWCNAGCQSAVTQGTGQTTYESCWSYLPGNQTVPSACTGVSTSNESPFTPPLFQYFGASGDTGESINSAAEPLDLYCTNHAGACSPSASIDDTPNLVDADIQSVEIDLTVLTGAGSSVPTHQVSPGTTVTDYLSLENLSG